MNRQGRYQTLSRLARGTVFMLSNAPADTKAWRVLRHRADGLTEVERLHEDRTLRRQFPRSTLMVFVPTEDGSEPEPTVEELEEIEQELEDMGLIEEREASIARQGGEQERRTMLGDWQSGPPKAELGDGGYLTLKTPTEGGN